jgi:hypothetical protein
MSLGDPPIRDEPKKVDPDEWRPHPTKPGLEVNTLTGRWRTSSYDYMAHPQYDPNPKRK